MAHKHVWQKGPLWQGERLDHNQAQIKTSISGEWQVCAICGKGVNIEEWKQDKAAKKMFKKVLKDVTPEMMEKEYKRMKDSGELKEVKTAFGTIIIKEHPKFSGQYTSHLKKGLI